jgi:hypothetical protein
MVDEQGELHRLMTMFGAVAGDAPTNGYVADSFNCLGATLL